VRWAIFCVHLSFEIARGGSSSSMHARIAEAAADFAVELYLFGISNEASIPFMCDILRLSACTFRAAL
jgi:hypothetical protein